MKYNLEKITNNSTVLVGTVVILVCGTVASLLQAFKLIA
jgi:hypothetical protein